MAGGSGACDEQDQDDDADEQRGRADADADERRAVGEIDASLPLLAADGVLARQAGLAVASLGVCFAFAAFFGRRILRGAGLVSWRVFGRSVFRRSLFGRRRLFGGRGGLFFAIGR